MPYSRSDDKIYLKSKPLTRILQRNKKEGKGQNIIKEFHQIAKKEVEEYLELRRAK